MNQVENSAKRQAKRMKVLETILAKIKQQEEIKKEYEIPGFTLDDLTPEEIILLKDVTNKDHSFLRYYWNVPQKWKFSGRWGMSCEEVMEFLLKSSEDSELSRNK